MTFLTLMKNPSLTQQEKVGFLHAVGVTGIITALQNDVFDKESLKEFGENIKSGKVKLVLRDPLFNKDYEKWIIQHDSTLVLWEETDKLKFVNLLYSSLQISSLLVSHGMTESLNTMIELVLERHLNHYINTIDLFDLPSMEIDDDFKPYYYLDLWAKMVYTVQEIQSGVRTFDEYYIKALDEISFAAVEYGEDLKILASDYLDEGIDDSFVLDPYFRDIDF